MSTNIELDNLNKFSNDLINNIKIIYVFGHKVSEVLIVTKDDKCFGFGQNEFGVLGLGHDIQVREPTIIEELCDKQIITFANGLHHVMAVTSDGKIYSWGRNDRNENKIIVLDKPKINENLINEMIIEISCGASHSTVLTEKSQVYVWGYNDCGQIGNGSEELFQLTPIMLNDFNNEKIIAISCGFSHSMALTECGHVYSWGNNESGQLGLEENGENYNIFRTRRIKENKPKLIKVNNKFIVKISCGSKHSLMLSRDGEIFAFGSNFFGQIGNNCFSDKFIPHKLHSNIKFTEIASHFRYNISIALSVENAFYIWGKCGEQEIETPKKTQFKSLDSIFLNYFQITHKPIKIFRNYRRKNDFAFDFEEINDKCFEKLFRWNRRKNTILEDLKMIFSSNIISRHRNFIEIRTDFEENFKFSFIFYDFDDEWPYSIIGRNALVVTESDEVFTIGSNSNGLIGFYNKNVINESSLVDELSHKKIIGFDNGIEHVIAMTEDNRIYIWGNNYLGQLGNETNNNFFVPEMLDKFRDERIVDVCCGDWHSMALTETGKVYAWGDNTYGQIGNGCDNKYQLTPIIVETFNNMKIIAISCGRNHSVVLSDNGFVYSWGLNNSGQLGFKDILALNSPKLVNETNFKIFIEKIKCGPYNSLLLSCDGDIYGFGFNDCGKFNKFSENKFKSAKVITQRKFIDIASHKHCNISVALSIDGVFYIWGDCGRENVTEPKPTEFNSFNQVFINFFNITYNRLNIERILCNKTLIETKQSGEYFKNFTEICVISFGTFGIVSKAKQKNKNEIFAVKKIAINDKSNDYILRELRILYDLKSVYIVEFKSAWIEENYLLKDRIENYVTKYNIESDHRLFDPKNHLLLHIQMELCFKTLKDIIKQTSRGMTRFGYYVSSELLIEILESVDYLHKQNPRIIHRDLKPSNILITFGINGRFAKLADFGLAKLHEFDEQSHTRGVGTLKYMASEIMNSKKYNTKSDIYSLGVIVQELFNFEPNKIGAKTDPQLREKYCNVLEMSEKMKTKNPEYRPNCETILNERTLWALSLSDIENDEKFSEICNQLFTIVENFSSFFIRKKYELFKQSKQNLE